LCRTDLKLVWFQLLQLVIAFRYFISRAFECTWAGSALQYRAAADHAGETPSHPLLCIP
jgi:hypothetical protein